MAMGSLEKGLFSFKIPQLSREINRGQRNPRKAERKRKELPKEEWGRDCPLPL